MNDFYDFDCDLLALLRTYRNAAEYAQFQDTSAQFLTLNCGDSEPSTYLKYLIVPGKDLYVISLYEIDTDAQVFVTSTSKLSAYYLTLFASVIPHQFRYQYMGSYLLAVFISDSLSVKSVDFFPVATGNLGIPNKGGIVCKLHAADSIFGFLGCHLNASRDSSGAGKRNSSLARILMHSSIRTENTLYVRLAYLADSHETLPDELLLLKHLPASLYDCEWFVVLGDLNYRVTSYLSAADVARYLISDYDFYREFLAGDELLQQMNYFQDRNAYPAFHSSSEWDTSDTSGVECYQNSVRTLSDADRAVYPLYTAICGVFAYFKELPITFLPTYCYCKKSNTYYTAEPKIRMPAFTDRVLWMQCDALCNFTAEYYARLTYEESDHKPVSLYSAFKTKIIDMAARNEYYERERAVLLKYRATLCPGFEIYTTSARLELAFNATTTLAVAVKNTHSTQAIRLSMQIPCKHAVRHALEVQISPLSLESFELVFRFDPFEAADRTQLCEVVYATSFKIVIRHAYKGQILQQREVDVECHFVGIDDFLNVISSDRNFEAPYYRLYSAKSDNITGSAYSAAYSDLQVLCGLVKFNHSAELAAVERLYRESSVTSGQKRSFAVFLLDSLGLIARNQVICLFTLAKDATDMRAAIARLLQPYDAALLFVFETLQNM